LLLNKEKSDFLRRVRAQPAALRKFLAYFQMLKSQVFFCQTSKEFIKAVSRLRELIRGKFRENEWRSKKELLKQET